uniref:Uncharacterized protein n=1 Tax=Bubo bubo TaxID=30461 RepID=A0A8C0EPR8_BUBBB
APASQSCWRGAAGFWGPAGGGGGASAGKSIPRDSREAEKLPETWKGATQCLVLAMSVLAALASTAKRINGRYERFLERTFPRFYVLYVTFTKGIQALFLEAKEIRKIKSKMSRQRLSVQQLPYREMERLRQFSPTPHPPQLIQTALKHPQGWG